MTFRNFLSKSRYNNLTLWPICCLICLAPSPFIVLKETNALLLLVCHFLFKKEMGVSPLIPFGLKCSPYGTVAMATLGRCHPLKNDPKKWRWFFWGRIVSSPEVTGHWNYLRENNILKKKCRRRQDWIIHLSAAAAGGLIVNNLSVRSNRIDAMSDQTGKIDLFWDEIAFF